MENLPPLRRLSKRLFGSTYTLEVGAAISARTDSSINPTELRKSLEHASEKPPAHSSVVKELEKLEDAGLLIRMATDGPYVRFERQPSVYFEMCDRLRNEVEGLPQAEKLF